MSLIRPQHSRPGGTTIGIGTHTMVIRPHVAVTPAVLEVRRIGRRLAQLTESLDGRAPDFERRAELAATTLLMAGEELDLAGVRP